MTKRVIFTLDNHHRDALEDYRVKHGLKSLNAAMRHLLDGFIEGEPGKMRDPARRIMEGLRDVQQMIEPVPPTPERLREVDASLKPVDPWDRVVGGKLTSDILQLGPTPVAAGSRLKTPKGRK